MKRRAWAGAVATALAWAGPTPGQSPRPAAPAAPAVASPPGATDGPRVGDEVVIRTSGQPERRVKVVRVGKTGDGETVVDVQDQATSIRYTVPAKVLAALARTASGNGPSTPAWAATPPAQNVVRPGSTVRTNPAPVPAQPQVTAPRPVQTVAPARGTPSVPVSRVAAPAPPPPPAQAARSVAPTSQSMPPRRLPAVTTASAVEPAEGDVYVVRTAGQPERRMRVFRVAQFAGADALADVVDESTGARYSVPSRVLMSMTRIPAPRTPVVQAPPTRPVVSTAAVELPTPPAPPTRPVSPGGDAGRPKPVATGDTNPGRFPTSLPLPAPPPGSFSPFTQRSATRPTELTTDRSPPSPSAVKSLLRDQTRAPLALATPATAPTYTPPPQQAAQPTPPPAAPVAVQPAPPQAAPERQAVAGVTAPDRPVRAVQMPVQPVSWPAAKPEPAVVAVASRTPPAPAPLPAPTVTRTTNVVVDPTPQTVQVVAASMPVYPSAPAAPPVRVASLPTPAAPPTVMPQLRPATFVAPSDPLPVHLVRPGSMSVPEAMADEIQPFASDLATALRPSMRERAATALASGRYGWKPEVKALLAKAVLTDPAPSVKAHCVRLLAQLGYHDRAYLEFLESCAESATPVVRDAAREALDKLAVRN